MAKRIRKAYMREETFTELIESARQALTYERGARSDYRVTQATIPASSRTISVGEVVPSKSITKSYRKHKNIPDKE